MIKDMVNGYVLGLVAMFLGAVLSLIVYLASIQLLQFALGRAWPWIGDVWFQAALVVISYIATVQVFNFLSDKRLMWGWPLVATAFAGLMSWLKFNILWTDEVLTVCVVTAAMSMASSLYQYRYHNRLARVTTT